MNLKLLVVAAIAVAAPVKEPKDAKREIVTVTVVATTAATSTATSTTAEGLLAKLFGDSDTSTTQTTVAAVSTTASTAAAATSTASTATTSSSGSFWSSLLSLLEGSSSSSSSSTAATTTSSTAAATSSASSSSSSSSGSWLSNLLSSLFGSSSSSSSSSSTSSATSSETATGTSSTETPGFSGLVTVVNSGGSTSASVSSATSSYTGSSSSSVSEVVAYAEEGAGITYSPYTESGSCKTASEVASDIAKLSAFGIIRLYSVDCSGIENVVAAMGSSQKLYLGVWSIDNLDTDLSSMAEQVLTGSRGWKAVHTVSIGNELVNAGTKTVAQVSAAVSEAREWFESNASAYTGYIVTVDTLAAVMADTSMCDISDYIAVNCHPYFSAIEASTSGTWLKEQVASLKSACNNDKSILITESGWPTYGDTLGEAVPSTANQLLAIKGIAEEMGSQVIMFTMYNDYWKDPGTYNVEQHWGIFGDPDA